jgi:hypothetical protein
MRLVTVLTAFLLLSQAVFCLPAHAERIGLSNLVVDNQEGRIKVRFGVDIKDVEAVSQALEKGEVLALQCRATLSRKRDYLWDTEGVSAETTSRLVLQDGGPYEISYPDGLREHYRGRDLALVMKEAWGAMNLDLGDWNTLARGNVYTLTLDIRLKRLDIASWTKGLLFFWNFDAVSPASYQLDFSY